MPPDTTVRCPRCGATRDVSFLAALRTVWPQCCDDAMWVEETSEDVAAALARLYAEAATPVGATRQRLDMGRN